MKPRKRTAWKIKREIEFAFRLGDNRKARSAFYKRSKHIHGLQHNTQDAVCNLVDSGVHTDSAGRLVNRFGVVEMVMNDYYTHPTMGNIIEQGLYRGCRIRYDRFIDAVIQQHEIIFQGDHWILYYSPHGYWVMDNLPF